MPTSPPRSAILLLVMMIGLGVVSVVGVPASVARCRGPIDGVDCPARPAETVEPTATIHVHVSYGGNVWDTAEGTPLPGAVVGVTTCYGYTYESEAESSGRYWVAGTVGEFACESVPWEARAVGFRSERRTVSYPGQFHYEDFVLQRFVPVATLFLPHGAHP